MAHEILIPSNVQACQCQDMSGDLQARIDLQARSAHIVSHGYYLRIMREAQRPMVAHIHGFYLPRLPRANSPRTEIGVVGCFEIRSSISENRRSRANYPDGSYRHRDKPKPFYVFPDRI
jgi:hypothetical protein